MKNTRPPESTIIALLAAAALAVACQRLDPNLTSGTVSNGGAGGTLPIVTPGSAGKTGSGGGGGSDCPTLRSEAHDILQTNCSICHQAPGTPSLYAGNFNFILDLAKLTSSTSPQSSSTLLLKYVVKGNPGQSYIYQRITNNSMPPVNRTQRPTAADKQVLNQWITKCIDDPTSPEGWPDVSAPTDAGVDTGPQLQPCGKAFVCPNGGCCVFSQCRPNGTTCGPLPNPIPGQTDLPGLPGTCTSGSCQNDQGQMCGNVGQPCCKFDSCTASQTSCLITDLTMCSACGGAGQPCCNPSSCLPGNACVGYGVGRVGTCQVCGALGQPCCGTGAAALQTCDAPLTCVTVTGTTTMCIAGSDGGAAAAATERTQ